jgi:two-component SAPR family response regulator
VKQVVAKPVATMQTLDVQTLEEALQLYTGDLLEGIYDDWAILEQERLRSLYLDCLEHLMRCYQQHGANAKGLD